jgi:hypothetical protein
LFNKLGDYKAEFIHQVDLIVKRPKKVIREESASEALKKVDTIIEAYVNDIGLVPDSFQLSRLSNFLILKSDEHYVLSVDQQKHRKRKEFPMTDTLKEVYDSEKKYRGKPVRKTINMHTQMEIEMQRYKKRLEEENK